MNNSTNGTSNSTEADAGQASISIIDALVADAFSFVELAKVDPVAALIQHQRLVVFVVIVAALPFLYRTVTKLLELPNDDLVDHRLKGNVEEEVEEAGLQEAAAKAPTSNLIWEIGVSERSASVAEDGRVRTIAFTKDLRPPTSSHIIATIIKAIAAPDYHNGMVIRRPNVAIFLETRMCSDKVVEDVTAGLSRLGIRIATMESIKGELPVLTKKHDEEIAGERQGEALADAAAAIVVPKPDPSVKFLPMPARSCFACKKEIDGKASQCSACKAIIYCSPECSKSDWPNHKKLCANFKKFMVRIDEWKLHDLPFEFYNTAKQLAGYNQVPFLSRHGLHNVGVFRRLCGCFAKVPFGELAGQFIVNLQASSPNPESKFRMLGLPMHAFPMAKPFPPNVNVSDIDSWKSLFEARGWPLDSPLPLVLDVPMTIWHFINKFVIKAKGNPENDGKSVRKITVHLIGVEVEADLIPLFEFLLPLLPNTQLAIHMIGPAISAQIHPQHRSMALRSDESNSSIFITLNTDVYQPKYVEGKAFPVSDSIPQELRNLFNFGPDKPDLVIGLNAALLMYAEWKPCVQMLSKMGQKVIFTDVLEQMIDAVDANLPMLGASLSIKAQPNPFKHPVFLFKQDMNLPGWTNGFYYGMGDLKN